jgi:hypothetical protein
VFCGHGDGSLVAGGGGGGCITANRNVSSGKAQFDLALPFGGSCTGAMCSLPLEIVSCINCRSSGGEGYYGMSMSLGSSAVWFSCTRRNFTTCCCKPFDLLSRYLIASQSIDAPAVALTLIIFRVLGQA